MTPSVNLSHRERAYALALYTVCPVGGAAEFQRKAWRELRDLIRNDYVRPSRWERFIEITERGP